MIEIHICCDYLNIYIIDLIVHRHNVTSDLETDNVG